MDRKTLGIFGFILLLLAGFVGWVMNIVALATASEALGMTMLRAVGVLIAPLGGVLGYI